MGLSVAANIYHFLSQTRELFGDEIFIQSSLDNINQGSDYDFPGSLQDFNDKINSCHKCQLGDARTKFVFGVGDPKADLLLVGEAPGVDEDRLGEPFVGRAGKLLDKILAAIHLNRTKGVYICNVLKCRPPNNRDPLPSEVDQCEPYLQHQIRLIKPQLIVALGRVAGKTLLKQDIPLKAMREKIYHYEEIPLIVTYHPAALLRNSGFKAPTWKDFQWIQSILDGKTNIG